MAEGPVCGVGLYRLSLQGALREVSFVLTVICYVRISFPTLFPILLLRSSKTRPDSVANGRRRLPHSALLLLTWSHAQRQRRLAQGA